MDISQTNGHQAQASTQQHNFIHNLLFPKKSWTEEEDMRLMSVVKKFGATKWSHIAKHIPYRTGKQCRERWFNHLSPSIKKEEWSTEQEWILFLGHTVLGSKWSKLAKLLQGRTDNSIKNHWNSIMRKKIPEMEDRLNHQLGNSVCAKHKATQLLKEYKKQGVELLIECEDSRGQELADSPQLNSQASSDSLSFSHLLKKIDERDTLNLQRKESYEYRGWQNFSTQKQKPKGIADKQNRLCQIEDFIEQDQDIPLPLPIKRLSSNDYSLYDRSRLLGKNDSQLIL